MKAARFIARRAEGSPPDGGGWTGEYQYTIDQVLENMIKRANEMNLRLIGAGGADEARFHHHADGADDELPAQRPAPGRALTRLNQLLPLKSLPPLPMPAVAVI